MPRIFLLAAAVFAIVNAHAKADIDWFLTDSGTLFLDRTNVVSTKRLPFTLLKGGSMRLICHREPRRLYSTPAK